MSTMEYQVQLTAIDDDGNETPLSPKNDIRDIHVGRLTNGELKLPGQHKNEVMDETLCNVKKILSQLMNIAQECRQVSQDVEHDSGIDIPSSSVTADLNKKIANLLTSVDNINTSLMGKAPTNHASTNTTYGGATAAMYGHVKTSDVYATSEADGAAQNSKAASQQALYNAYNTLNTNKAPNNHAVNAGTYGKGSSSVYGHVKTSDTYDATSNDSAEVATRKALYNAYTELKGTNDSQNTALAGKAPTSHASSATTYGVGTTGNYGHLKISDSYDSDNSGSGAASHGVAASSWAVYRAYSALKTAVDGKLASGHADEKATGSKWSHVKLSDNYTESAGAASSGIGASSYAVCTAYNTLSGLITSMQNTVNTLSDKIGDGSKEWHVHKVYETSFTGASGQATGSMHIDDLNEDDILVVTMRVDINNTGGTSGNYDVDTWFNITVSKYILDQDWANTTSYKVTHKTFAYSNDMAHYFAKHTYCSTNTSIFLGSSSVEWSSYISSTASNADAAVENANKNVNIGDMRIATTLYNTSNNYYTGAPISIDMRVIHLKR